MKIRIKDWQCSESIENICQNNKCFYIQRDRFGRNPWWNPHDDALEKQGIKTHNQILADTYGFEFPKLKYGNIGTNCIYVNREELGTFGSDDGLEHRNGIIECYSAIFGTLKDIIEIRIEHYGR